MKHLSICLLLFGFFLCSACFEIVEEITLNEDGSGNAKIAIDMRSLMSVMGNFMPDSVKNTLSFEKDMAQIAGKYAKIEGISNTQITRLEAYWIQLSFEFGNFEALNEAMSYSSMEQKGNMAMDSRYEWKKGRLLRYTHYAPSLESDLQNVDGQKAVSLLGGMRKPTYKVIYHLPNAIKKADITDQNSQFRVQGNSVAVEYDLLQIIGKTGTLMSHEIKF